MTKNDMVQISKGRFPDHLSDEEKIKLLEEVKEKCEKESADLKEILHWARRQQNLTS